MAVLGKAAILVGFAVTFYGIVVTLVALTGSLTPEKRRCAIESGRRAVYVLAAVLTVAFVALEILFLTDDFSIALVADHSSTTTTFFYKATALWSSQEGSLLLWAWLLSLWSSLVLWRSHRRLSELAPVATVVLLAFAAFFVGLIVVGTSPFQAVTPAPLEGQGLNPLLRYPSMMFHPPMLYSGYTLATVPFAFGVAALVTGKLDSLWIGSVRRFALASWACLGIGILLGARWSYAELGWGGYWAWDAVENAALMPWLTLTAFLHSAMIQERRGMLKAWNVSLVLASGTLAIMGTFLVRSGIISSIHAFGASTLGIPFLVLIVILILLSVSLVVWRRRSLRSENKIDSILSRESIFLLNNLVLIALAFVVFWGTYFPLISEAATGSSATIGPTWYGRYIGPLAIVLVFLSGLGPVLAWRRINLASIGKSLIAPLVGAAAVAISCLAAGVDDTLAIVAFAVGTFSICAVLQEYWRGTRARSTMAKEPFPKAFIQLVRRNRRRYGGYIAHIGIAVLFIGVAASSAFQKVEDRRLKVGGSVSVEGYRFDYIRATSDLSNEKIVFGAVLRVYKDGKYLTTLRPNRGYYQSQDPSLGSIGRFFEGEATSEIGLKTGFRRDIWTAVQPDLTSFKKIIATANRKFGDSDPDTQALIIAAIAHRYKTKTPPATFRVIVSPLVSWIWLGGIIIGLGSLVAIWPGPERARRRISSADAAKLAQELKQA